jgi:hypothetical protein
MERYITLEEKVEEILDQWREETGHTDEEISSVRALYVDREFDIYTISFRYGNTAYTVKSIPTENGPTLINV